MERCDVCGNSYDDTFRVIRRDGSEGVFDSFECAIERFAPRCSHCGCRVIGHGVDPGGVIYCCDHCARAASATAVKQSSRATQSEAGRVEWSILLLFGVTIPLFAVLYVLLDGP